MTIANSAGSSLIVWTAGGIGLTAHLVDFGMSFEVALDGKSSTAAGFLAHEWSFSSIYSTKRQCRKIRMGDGTHGNTCVSSTSSAWRMSLRKMHKCTLARLTNPLLHHSTRPCPRSTLTPFLRSRPGPPSLASRDRHPYRHRRAAFDLRAPSSSPESRVKRRRPRHPSRGRLYCHARDQGRRSRVRVKAASPRWWVAESMNVFAVQSTRVSLTLGGESGLNEQSVGVRAEAGICPWP